jgi:hypothetical protein
MDDVIPPPEASQVSLNSTTETSGSSLVASAHIVLPTTATFVDVSPTHTLFEQIEWLVSKKITSGYVSNGNREYRPANNVTRSEMATFLYRVAGSPAFTAPAISPFVDVATNAGYYKAVAWLESEKITSGYVSNGNREYRPGNNVTRSEMATFLYRVAGSPAFTAPAISPFVDVATNAGYYKAVAWLESKKITSGYVSNGNREYRPANNVTRGEMATFLWRTAVEYQSALADGVSNTTTTTKITLNFSKDIAALTKENVTITGVKVTKEALSRVSVGVYELSISGTWANNTSVNVAVAKTGYPFIPAVQKTILYTKAVSYKDLTADGVSNTTTTTKITLKFDKDIAALTKENVTVTGVKVTKEALSRVSVGVYELSISGTWANNTSVNVAVTKTENIITPTNRSVSLYSDTTDWNTIVLSANVVNDDQTVRVTKYFANDYSVDWGDGSSVENVVSNITHTYSTADVYSITLKSANIAVDTPYWTFKSTTLPLIPTYGTTATDIEITSMPPMQAFMSSNATAGDNFFSQFNTSGALVSLPKGSFDISNITNVGDSFFSGFNNGGALVSLPEGSFDTSNITSVGSRFFSSFCSDGVLASLPEGSFDISAISSVGEYFFFDFNWHGFLVSLPEGSFNIRSITKAADYFFYGFNNGGALVSLPEGSFNTNNITRAGIDFFSRFNAEGALTSLPVGSFNVDNLLFASSGYFQYFNSGGKLPNWSTP